MRSELQDRMSLLERGMQEGHDQDGAKISQLTSDLDVVTKRMGVTMQELQQARGITEALKQEHARTALRLRNELASKADSTLVSEVQHEATTKLAEVQQDATTKIGAVSGEVQVVRTDLDTTRQDLASSLKDISDVRTQIARNSTELAELRRKGERDYFEFDIPKSKNFARIADVQVQLTKTDVKRQKYSVLLQADDNRVEKRDRMTNEPIQFLVGRDRLRYEFVVNYIDKDRIRGYVSTPKDKILSAEGPSFRRAQ
jgi:predicted  nucleic acid-binding Zn-ribbon protein